MQQKRRLILHVGLHKTGTSYIQKVIAENLAVFRTAGVVTARMFHADQGQHHKLAKLLAKGKEDNFIAALDKPGEAILVTSEYFSHWLNRTDKAQLQAFAARLGEKFEVRIVLFIRRQDFLKESVFSEAAMNWYRGTIEAEQHYYYDFNKFARQLCQIFGKENIGLGLYRDDRPIDLMAEFLRVAQIDVEPRTLKPVLPQRVSPGRRKVALIAEMDKRDRGGFRVIRNAILGSTAIWDDGIKYQMSPEARRAFLRKYHASNQKLAELFDMDDDARAYLLSDELHQVPWVPMKPITSKERAAVTKLIDRPLTRLLRKVTGFFHSVGRSRARRSVRRSTRQDRREGDKG